MRINLHTTTGTDFGWFGDAVYTVLYILRLVVASFAYWALGAILTFVPLCALAAAFDLSNQSAWAWGLVILPATVGAGTICWRWDRIKTEAAKVALSKESTEEMIEAIIAGVRVIVLGPIALLITALAIAAGLLLLWGGYVLLAALPISVAVVVGAMLIALAIFAVAKASA